MGSERTVLIVDDHQGFRATARMLMEFGGWRVVGEAGSAAEAVDAARALCPQVVLLDVNLPDGDGFAVARCICTAPDPPAVVLVSSRDDAGYATLAEGSGAQGFIPKARLSCTAITELLP